MTFTSTPIYPSTTTITLSSIVVWARYKILIRISKLLMHFSRFDLWRHIYFYFSLGQKWNWKQVRFRRKNSQGSVCFKNCLICPSEYNIYRIYVTVMFECLDFKKVATLFIWICCEKCMVLNMYIGTWIKVMPHHNRQISKWALLKNFNWTCTGCNKKMDPLKSGF